MRRSLLLIFISQFLLLTLVIHKHYLMAGGWGVLGFCWVQKRHKGVWIFMMVMSLFSLFISTRHYQALPESLSGLGIIQSVQSNSVLKYEGYRILVRTAGTLEEGLYEFKMVQNQENFQNPGMFNYEHYLYSLGYAGAVQEDQINLKLIQSRPTLIGRWYGMIEERIENLFSKEAQPYIQGLLLGDKSRLDQETMTMFRNNGTSHVLAISGLHIGVLVAVLMTALSRVQWRQPMVLGLLFLYLVLVGMPFSGLRAFGMFLALQMAGVMARKYDLLQALGLVGSLILMVRPYAVGHTGFQFSVVAIMIIGVWMSYFFRRSAWAWLLMPLVIQVGMTPLMVYHNNTVHVVSAFINALVVPLITLIFNLSLLCLVSGFQILSPLVEALLYYVLEVNQWFYRPFFLKTIPSPKGLMVLSLYLVLALWFEKDFRKSLYKILLGQLTVMLLYSVLVVEVYFLDIGQGDACLIKDWPYAYMVDAGPDYPMIQSILLKNGIGKIDLFFMSHDHMDHIGGIQHLGGLIGETIFYHQSPNVYADLMNSRPFRHMIGAGKVNFSPIVYPVHESGNNASMVLNLQVYGRQILFTGDIEEAVEVKLTPLQSVDILKVPHHGSKTSSSPTFLSQLMPQVAVIPVGRNYFGHPHPIVLERYEAIGAQIFQTRQGCVKITLWPGGFYWIKQES